LTSAKLKTVQPSIQESLYPFSDCFGCGPANARGLQIRSFADGEAVVAEFTPWPEHGNGTGFVNGGIIATVLDCHSGAAMMRETLKLSGLNEISAEYMYLTAGLDIRYRRPTPMETFSVRAHVTHVDDTKMDIEVELIADGKVRVNGATHWRRFRP
jgi:acyl-coenzyme A thioesterase PaaI-like protein